jgi:spore maturation protein CgeB
VNVLSIVVRSYYGTTALEPMFLYFTRPLVELGHEVDTFDHYGAVRRLGRGPATEAMVEKIRAGRYDVVFYQTAGNEPVDTAPLKELSRQRPIVAWNSDDDWQWPSTSQRAGDFTFMVTTYPSVYRAHRDKYPNLLLSQWACLETREPRFPKTIDFSFAGAVYKIRNGDCRRLRRKAKLRCFGRGARLANLGIPYFKGAFRFPWLSGAAIDFDRINAVWEKTRISYTPLKGGPSGEVLSIKSRVFDMGYARTLMLCEAAPDLEAYYTDGKELVTFSSLDEAGDKVQFYRKNESARAAIANRYRERTLREHLWTHRFQALFAAMGIRESGHAG